MQDKKELISKSKALIRDYWTPTLFDKIMGEPDHIKYDDSGKPYRYFWYMERLERGEEHPLFLKKKAKEDAKRAKSEQPQETPESEALNINNVLKLKKILKSDLLLVDIPQKGTLEAVFSDSLNQLNKTTLLLKASRTSSFEAFQRVYGELRDPELNPYCQLYRKIAEERKDLAFECGAHYLAKLHNIFYEDRWVTKTVTVRGKKLVT